MNHLGDLCQPRIGGCELAIGRVEGPSRGRSRFPGQVMRFCRLSTERCSAAACSDPDGPARSSCARFTEQKLLDRFQLAGAIPATVFWPLILRRLRI